MSNPSVSYAPRTDATPAAEISAITSVYRFVLDCRAKKEGSRPGAPDAGKEINERSGKAIIPK